MQDLASINQKFISEAPSKLLENLQWTFAELTFRMKIIIDYKLLTEKSLENRKMVLLTGLQLNGLHTSQKILFYLLATISERQRCDVVKCSNLKKKKNKFL